MVVYIKHSTSYIPFTKQSILYYKEIKDDLLYLIDKYELYIDKTLFAVLPYMEGAVDVDSFMDWFLTRMHNAINQLKCNCKKPFTVFNSKTLIDEYLLTTNKTT